MNQFDIRFVIVACTIVLAGCPGKGNNGNDPDRPNSGLPDVGIDGGLPDGGAQNSAPTAPEVELVEVEGAAPRTYQCVASGSVDPDGDEVSYAIAWAVNGESIEVAGDTFTARDQARGDTLECTAIATDGVLESEPVTAGVELGNHPPFAPELAVVPEAPASEDEVECVVATESVDPDGDEVTYTFVWVGPNGTVEGATLPAAETVRDDEWTCEVTPADTEEGEVATISIRVGNTAPEPATVELVPGEPRTGDDIECVASDLVDPEGDAVEVSYSWSIDGTDSATTANILPASETAKGNVVECTVVVNDGFLNSEPVTASTTIANTAPEAPVVSLDPAQPSTTDDIDCVASTPADADNDAVTLSYSWTIDGATLPGAAGPTLDASEFSKGQTVECAVSADDGTDTTVASASVVIANSAPTAPTVTIVPGSPTTTTDLACAAAGATDPDNDALTFTYTWSVNGTAAGTGPTLASNNFDKGDLVECAAAATDGDLTSAPGKGSTTIENTAPTSATVAISPASPATTDDLTCSASGSSDVDSDSVSYRFVWTVNGTSAGTTDTLAASEFAKGDTVVCSVTATDGTDDSPPQTATTTIANTGPTAPTVTVTPANPVTTDTLTCTPTGATDIDGDNLTYTYAWTINGSASTQTSSTLASSNFSRGDNVTCSVTVSDGEDAATAGDSVTIENTAPTAPTVSISPAAPTATDDLSCAATGSTDADNDSVTYSYVWTVNGASAGTGATLAAAVFASGDSVECSATATDGDLTSPTAAASLTIENTPPTAPVVTLTPSAPATADDVTCEASGSTDVDGDSVSYSYSWTVNGVAAGTTATLSATEFAKNDTIECTAVATDGTDSAAPQTASVVIGNTAPTAATVAVTPANPVTTDTLTCTPTGATDIDGDNLSYTYAWTINGSASTQTSSTLASSNFSRGDNVTCSVTVSDGEDAATAGDSVTIENTAPTAPTVSISPSFVQTTDDLTCTATGSSDADGDSISYTYVWTVDGVAAGTGATLASSEFTRGRSVECAATATDGDLVSTAGLDSVTVANTAPTVPTVSISPSPATTTETLTCSASGSTDADGDTVVYEYTWRVNGSVASTTDTLNSSAFQKGDGVSCEVRASDGTGFSLVSSVVSIVNTPPSAPTVSISPASPSDLQDLTCSASGATDVDGDSIGYSYVWSVDGATSAITTATVAASETGAGETWSCTATPSDGSADGPSGTASVSVVSACGNGVVDPGEDCDDQNLDDTDGCSSACQFVTCVGTYVENQFDGVTTYSGNIAYSLPNTVYLDWVTSSKGIQAVNSKLDNLVVTDGSGTVLYSDNFDSVGSWIIRKGAIGTTTISGGTANAGSDWNIFYLGGQGFDPTGGLVVTADVLWSSTTSNFGFFLVDVDPAVNVVSTELLGGSHDLQEYASGSGPAVSAMFDDLAGGGIVDTAPWSEPTAGWHEMSVRFEPQCTCGDGVVDFGETCDDGNVTPGDGCSAECKVEGLESCAAILQQDPTATSGVYPIDPDGAGTGEAPLNVYCDMTTDGGGWTLVAAGGADCSSFTEQQNSDTSTCGWLPYAVVSNLAQQSTAVRLQTGTSFGNWTSTANSTNANALTAFGTPNGTWHNGATFDNWQFTNSCSPGEANGWPNMFHGCGLCQSVHWIKGTSGTYYHGRVCSIAAGRDPRSATWLR